MEKAGSIKNSVTASRLSAWALKKLVVGGAVGLGKQGLVTAVHAGGPRRGGADVGGQHPDSGPAGRGVRDTGRAGVGSAAVLG